MSATLWPAPPTPTARGFWRAFERPAAPCGGATAKPVPRPKADPPRVAVSPPPARKPAATADGLFGLCVQFDVWFRPTVGTAGAAATCKYKIRPGAFADTLARVEAGRAVIALRFTHDGDLTLCDTRDGLTVREVGGGLFFALKPTTARGRRAVALALGCGLREVSIGADVVAGSLYGDGTPDARTVVTAAALTEISLVPRGACPGTYFEAA